MDAFPMGYEFTLQVDLGCKRTLMAIGRSNIQDHDVYMLCAWTSVHDREQPECLTVFEITLNGHKWWRQAHCARIDSSNSQGDKVESSRVYIDSLLIDEAQTI